MKKSKVFMATGALILAISAIFATKANKKFNLALTGVSNSGLFHFQQLGGSTDIMTTSGGATPQLYMKICTSSGFAVAGNGDNLETKVDNHPIYFR
jgi:hypothetical protein